jgi:hypothetical protein
MRARGSQSYEVTNKGEADSWASRNMLVLGIIVGGVLVFHLTHFWAKMQLAEFTGGHAQNGNELMNLTFRKHLDCNLLYNMVYSPLVPSYSWILECIPDCGRQ